MPEFQYGKSINDSFKLIFDNLYIFVPILSVSVIGLLISPLNFKMIDTSGDLNLQFIMANISFVIFVAFLYSVLFILTFIAYGWTFALLGQIIKKGKADLFWELRNGIRKGLKFLLINLLLFLIIIGFTLILFILIFTSSSVMSFSIVLGIIFAILFILFFIIGAIIFVLAFMYIVPILALEDFGPINTMKLSYEHFKNNKGHSLALFGIGILLVLIAVTGMYVILFLVTGSISNEALLRYMINQPSYYSLATFFAGLPSTFVVVWSFVFITIAYVRKKKLLKKPLV